MHSYSIKGDNATQKHALLIKIYFWGKKVIIGIL